MIMFSLFYLFMATLDWRNFVFVFLMFPIIYLVYYPFFKIYEKQCLEKEKAEEEAELEAMNK